MNTPDEARELMAQHRQQEKRQIQATIARSLVALEIPADAATKIQEEARDGMTAHRQAQTHRQESMLRRVAAEVGLSLERVKDSQA